jgi:hypothetical protein
MVDRLLEVEPRRGRELGVVAALSLLLAFAVYGPHLVHGGFTLDDWAMTSDSQRYTGLGGMLAHAHAFLTGNGGHGKILMTSGTRPVASLYFALLNFAFGTHMRLYLGLALVLAALMATLTYAALRRFKLPPIHAGAIALLVILFPAADSTRLWPAAAHIQLAMSFYIAGLLLALRGVERPARQTLAFHVGSIACYALSLLTYEVATAFIFFSFVLYRTATPSWRRIFGRAVVDWVTLASVVLYLRLSKSLLANPPTPWRDMFQRARDILGQARRLIQSLGIADGPDRMPSVLIALVVIAALVVWLVTRDQVLRRWLVFAAGGLIILALGYTSFLPAGVFYSPLTPGIGNRTNVASSIGYVLFIYAVLALLVRLLSRLVATVARRDGFSRAERLGAAALAVGAAVVLGALWIHHVEQDQRAWDRAFSIDERVLSVLRRYPGQPAPGSTIFTFGEPGTTAPLVPTFFASWDLSGAVRILWHDQTLHGIPVVTAGSGSTPVHVVCRSAGVVPRGFLYKPKDTSPYGRAVFVDIPHRTFHIVKDPTECRDVLRTVVS